MNGAPSAPHFYFTYPERRSGGMPRPGGVLVWLQRLAIFRAVAERMGNGKQQFKFCGAHPHVNKGPLFYITAKQRRDGMHLLDMAADSLRYVASSNSSTGTRAKGFLAIKSGNLCSPLGSITCTVGMLTPFSAGNIRTRRGLGAGLKS